MNQQQIAKQTLMAQHQITAQLAEVYTGAWATFRKIMKEDGTEEMLVSVVNTLLDLMAKENIGALMAAQIKSEELETQAGKLLVMAATVEILLGKFSAGQQISVIQLT